ncbi:MAG TPA: glycosyltransferase [Actinomycetota bacterium]|nr:glycosyltransferase [Actinomycetota bacterium]
MRVLLWHGWLLEATGSNVYTAKAAEAMRRAGHHVAILCQDPHPERYPFVDAWGVVDGTGVRLAGDTGVPRATGRVTLLRPEIGRLLPVFVLDEYEGFDVRRFVDLDDAALSGYLERNVQALRAAAAWHRPDAAIAGHVVPGGVVAARALGAGAYVLKVHGSDLEYAIRPQARYRPLAAEALAGARAVTGASRDVLERALAFAPEARGRERVVAPGVEADRFRPRARREALQDAGARLAADPQPRAGRPDALDDVMREALAARDGRALHDLALRYDQGAPDPGAAARLRALAAFEGPLVGYCGKLIPQKGVEVLLEALVRARPVAAALLVVGYGQYREWLAGLVDALDGGDADAVAWLREAGPMALDLDPAAVRAAAGFGSRITFTGRLDHRYAPEALAAMDVQVTPSLLEEAFGMVAAEGAAAGNLPLVARHSGLAEVGQSLEAAVGRPGLFTYEPGPGAGARIAAGIERLLGLPEAERHDLRATVSDVARREWSWDHTARELLAPFAGATR